MSVVATSRVEVAIGGDYQTVVNADAPTVYWGLNEATGSVTTDAGTVGTIVGNVTKGVASPIPSGHTCFLFDGASSYVQKAALGPPVYIGAKTLSLEAWVWLSAAGMGTTRTIWGCDVITGGLWLGVTTADKFSAGNASSKAYVTDASARTASTWYHVVATYDGSDWRLYVNGALAVGPTTSGGHDSDQWADVIVGADHVAGYGHFMDGRIEECALYLTELSAARVLAHYTAAQWTNLATDVLLPVRCQYGISGNGPTDCVADSGELHFDLDNSAGNSGGTLGWYSPAGAGVRSGWAFGIPVRWVVTYSGVDYVRFRGKVAEIQPDPGRRRDRRVHVVAYDAMRDLAEAEARAVNIQVGQTDTALITALLDAMPLSAQPFGRSMDTALDTYPYAFDLLGPGQPVVGAVADVVVSGLGALYCTGDGVVTWKTRASLQVVASAYALSDDMVGLDVPSSLEGVFNRVRATIHPKTVDATSTTVLWSQTGGEAAAPLVAPGQSLTIWGTYFDPSNTLKLIGGTAAVAPVASTDYLANSAADGSGTNLTASVAVTATAFASTVKFVVVNSGAVPAYVTALQVRGKGIYDDGPSTFESYTAKAYGDRRVDIDMPYQDDPQVGQSAADYVNIQFNSLTHQVSGVRFVATKSAAALVQALTREPTDCVSVTETVTGLSAAACVIRSVSLEWTSARQLICRWRLAPGLPFSFWQLGVAGFGELGSATVLGF